MVAKHSVKVNGVWYRAGEEIAPALKNDFSIDGKVYIKINGQYSVTPESELEKEIREVQEANKE